MIATRLDDDRRDDILLPNVRLGDVLNLCTARLRQFLGVRRDEITQGFGKTRGVKNENVLRVQKAGYPRRLACSRQRPNNKDPVVKRRYARDLVEVTCNKRSFCAASTWSNRALFL